MLLPSVLWLSCALISYSEGAPIDFPDLTKFKQECEPFRCRPKRTPAPAVAPSTVTSFNHVRDFEFTSNGCGTSGMSVATAQEYQECCDWHDACYSTCGMPKANCEKRLHKCFKAKCSALQDATKQEECTTTAKIFYISANMMGCQAYQDAQKEACECVPIDKAATATRERLEYFLEQNNAPEEELQDDALDALLAKYKGQEPTLFLRLLKKYPHALKHDALKTNYMDTIVNDVDTSVKKKMKKQRAKKKEVPVDEHEDL
ncbi:hypothetical protein CCR75_001297 [Bremia lactucae]|uniref:Phospholipase A2 n=1 Tax=Bremia lactucae TaxID=4779 RepID=A0A976FMY6_BRELC|nr:hypothetical protein CCR75_001297 [Bremia lactucae]